MSGEDDPGRVVAGLAEDVRALNAARLAEWERHREDRERGWAAFLAAGGNPDHAPPWLAPPAPLTIF